MTADIISLPSARQHEKQVQDLLVQIGTRAADLARIEPQWAYRIGLMLRAVAESTCESPPGGAA